MKGEYLMKQNKFITVLTLILTLSLSVFGNFTVAEAKAKSTPSADGYIQLLAYDKDGYINWSNSKYIYVGKNMEESETVSEIEGISYNKDNNTLTISDYSNPKTGITIANMGTSFKIEVVGSKNSLQNITSFNNLTINGSGKLTINSNKKCNNGGILVSSDSSAVKITFAKSVKVTSYGQKYADSLCVVSTTKKLSKAIIKKGGSMTKCVADGKSESGARRYICKKSKFVKK